MIQFPRKCKPVVISGLAFLSLFLLYIFVGSIFDIKELAFDFILTKPISPGKMWSYYRCNRLVWLKNFSESNFSNYRTKKKRILKEKSNELISTDQVYRMEQSILENTQMFVVFESKFILLHKNLQFCQILFSYPESIEIYSNSS